MDIEEKTTGEPKEDVLTLEEQLEKMKDLWLRALAENQNLQRRFQREIEDALKFSKTKFAKDVLLVLDNLERAAILCEDETCNFKAVKDGLLATLKEFEKALFMNEIKKVEAKIGGVFDPHFHQAITEADGGAPGTIASILQDGYEISGRLLRPAMVVVCK